MKDKGQDSLDNLPMPKVSAVSGWLAYCVICFGALLAGKAVVGGFSDWSIKINVSDIIIALVVGTVLHFKSNKNNTKKG